jgi:tetratricopeptide (TPR) repeat protein
MTATLSVLSALLLGAASPWLTGPVLGADPVAMAREAAALAPPADTDIDVLLEEANVLLDEQGRASTTYRLVYRALTKEGAERWSEVGRSWAPWHQARPEVRARVIAPDGAVHLLDPATLVEAGLGREDEGIYSDRRVLKGPLPAVDAGTVVEETEAVRDLTPLFEAGAVRRFYVGRDGPVRTIRLTIDAPRGLPLVWLARGGLTGTPAETTRDGRRVLAWEWTSVAARSRGEPLAPPDVGQPHLAFGTGRSWSAVASAYAAVAERQLGGSELAAVASQVIPRGASREAAAQAVLDWQRGRVRYTGLELGEQALVPSRPAETLQRRYGDCKDLSLLVAGVLRAGGYGASLALVRAGGDEAADLPGLGEFDHAIVAVAGAPPLFVDPTDPVTPAGELAAALQGRLALVAAPGTTGLTRLPERPATENRIEVSREIRLPENGWSDASETEVLTGWPASDQRASLGRVDPRDRAERDQELVAGHFVDATGGEVRLEGVERSSGPVTITLTGRGSHWGITRADDAEAVLSAAYLLDWLPPPVRPRAAKGSEPAGREPGARAREPADQPRRTDLLLPIAYQGTLRYRAVPPPGFEVELPLPEPGRVALPALSLESRFALEPDGSVVGVHQLLVSRRRLTATEVEALREGLPPLLEDGPRIRFVRTAGRLLEAGRGREALDELKRLIALHPAEARHWNHLAQALLRLGMGEAARAAAAKAVALEPSNGWAHRVLATALEHDALGRWLAPGCDLAGALAAQRRAVELDREPAVRAHLAFLLEHGEGCERYGEGARLDEAASVYRYIRTELKSKEHDRELLAVLLRAGRFADAGPVARDLPDGPEKRAALLSIRAATEGVEAAARDALRIPSSERAAVLDQTAQHLVLARRYADASRLLEGGSAGTPQSAQLKARAAVLARVVRVESLTFDAKDPRSLPPRLFRAMAEGGEAWKSVPELRESPPGGTSPFSPAMAAAFRRGLRASSGLPDRVALDAGVSLLETRAEGDPAKALRLIGTTPSLPAPLTFVVVKDPRGWRLVTAEPVAAGLGAVARSLVDAGDVGGARAVLELARQEGGEPAEGRPASVLTALAPEGREVPAEGLRLAAAALESFGTPDAVRALLERARQTATEPGIRRALGWALAAGHVRRERWREVVPIADELLAADPASEPAFNLKAGALLELGQTEELARAAASRRQLVPTDLVASRALLSVALRSGDVAAVLAQERGLVQGGRASASDHNNLAWAMLFQSPLLPEALEQARRAVELTHDREAAFLHTLATVHAVRGEAPEAMQLLRRAVERAGAGNRPESHDWLVMGLIAEQYGLATEAATAYRRVTPPERPDGLSSQELAARRLRVLEATAPPARP